MPSTQISSSPAEPSSPLESDFASANLDLDTADPDHAADADLVSPDPDHGTSMTIAAADADLTTSDPNHATSITIVNSASGKGKTKKKKKEPLKVVKNERKRNFTAEEVQVIMQEAGNNTTVLKGRFNPGITSEVKEKVWVSITKSVNFINGKGDRDWRDVRKKWVDTSCSARTKLRNIHKEQRKTGGGQSSAPPLSKVESLAIDSIAGTTVSGIPGGIDTTEVSRSSRSLATSGGLITFSSMLLNDIDTDSEIYFDLNSNHGSSTPIPSPDTSQRSLQPIQNPFTQPATQPSSQQSSQPSTQPSPQPSPQPSSQLQTPPTMRSSSRTPLRATTGSIRSSRTVTRDVRNEEFKQLLAERKRTNDIMDELLKL